MCSRKNRLSANEEFLVRFWKAMNHFDGAVELGLPREQAFAELKKLRDDDDLMDDLVREDVGGVR